MHTTAERLDKQRREVSEKPNISQQQFEEIERYLQQQMTAVESSDFENKLFTDAALKAATEQMQLLSTAIAEAELTAKMPSFHNNNARQKKAKHTICFNVYMACCCGCYNSCILCLPHWQYR